MMDYKRLRGYMMSAISMGIGLTLLSLLLHHRTPSLLLIAGGAVAGVILEAVVVKWRQFSKSDDRDIISQSA